MKKSFFVVIAFVFALGAFVYYNNLPKTNKPDNAGMVVATNKKAVLYKSPNCGCCVGYAKALRQNGFEVEIISVNDISSIKNKYGIPTDKQSCHTVVIGDYFVEGHVPMEAVNKLVKENPDIDGIGLPRMPTGTPGMPGPKRGPFNIYQLNNGEFSQFMVL